MSVLERRDSSVSAWLEHPTVRGLRRNPSAAAGALVVAALTLLAIVGPFLTPYDPNGQHLEARLQGPSLAHPLGTDQLGRDVATRIVYGTRITLGIAVLVTVVRLTIGVVVGLVAGYCGGWIDEALMRVVDILLAFPGIILALVVAGILGPSLTNLVLALAVVGWTRYARVVRSSVLELRERPFVAASRLTGAPRRRVLRRHVLPNVAGPVVVLATLDLGGVILGAAGLSFLGLGAQPPAPEWGTMLSTGRHHLQEASWLVNAPGIAIVLAVLGTNLLGDGLRDALDPNDRAEQSGRTEVSRRE
ncbi:nickel transporter permease [Natronorubrum daqingense]|uniref:Peptide ABC transporter permease n=1 Tax=Natronorubrum daqingense TaxID=588898 RepID=A0A1N7EKZ9_9EURY|nr:nickel transporter permease [Natronorubrum daqingense]APX97889.1 peptide ABC transporter permease [Natronorubrum daqingense]SIR88688.1 peptide/nickel transport system permease protein [Natronorubrum daqingense]